MSTTSTDVDTLIRNGDVFSIISYIGLGAELQSRRLCNSFFNALSDHPTVNVVLDYYTYKTSLKEIINDFSDFEFWRRDSKKWKGCRVFLLNNAGDVLCIETSGRQVNLTPFGSEILDAPIGDDKDPDSNVYCARVLKNSKRKKENVSQKNAIRLWNGRIFDSLEMISKVRQLAKAGIATPDHIIVLEEFPLLSPHDAVGDLDICISTLKKGIEIDRNPDRFVHYVKSIHYPADNWMEFKNEMRELAREIVDSEEKQTADAFSIFISYDLEKRVCLNQEEEFKSLFRYVCDRFPKVEICVNGLTSGVGQGKSIALDIHREELRLTAEITEGLENIAITDMFGFTLREKFLKVQQCDFFFAPKGNASLIPLLIDIPGFFYGAPEFMMKIPIFDHISEHARAVSEDDVVTEREDYAMRKVNFGQDDGTRLSYRLKSGTLLRLFEGSI